MSKLQFLSKNLIVENNGSFSMAAGTENASFPLTNIPKKFTTKVFRSNENTCEVVIDLQQNSTIDTIALAGNALTGLGFTAATFQISATLVFSGPTTIIDVSQEFNIAYKSFTAEVGRYVKINLTGGGSYCEISNLFIGQADVIENNSISVSSFRYSNRDNSTTKTNQYGQEFTDKRNNQTEIRGTIQYCNDTEFQQIDDIVLRHLDKTPLWMIIDSTSNILSDGNYRFTGYFSLQNNPRWTATGYGLFNISLALREVV